MPIEISGADEICRCLIFSKAFQGSIHVDTMLWQFGKTADDGASHESAVLRRLAPEVDDVHAIGCKIAAIQNERLGQPEPGPKRRYYCGFRSAPFGDLPTEGDGYQIKFTQKTEFGEKAHVDVALIYTVEGKSARANCRTDAGLALAEPFGPPAPHTCPCDEDDQERPIAKWGEQCLYGGLHGRWSSLLTKGAADAVAPAPANDAEPFLDL